MTDPHSQRGRWALQTVVICFLSVGVSGRRIMHAGGVARRSHTIPVPVIKRIFIQEVHRENMFTARLLFFT